MVDLGIINFRLAKGVSRTWFSTTMAGFLLQRRGNYIGPQRTSRPTAISAASWLPEQAGCQSKLAAESELASSIERILLSVKWSLL